MAEAVPFGIVTNILTNLGSSAFLKISSVYGVKNDMRKLESTISTIKAALLDADQRQEHSHFVRDWIKELNYVVYDADDAMDAFSTKALQHELNSTDGRVLNMQQVREFFSTSNSFALRYKMGQKIKEIRKRLDEIAANMSNFKFKPETVLVEARADYNERETDSFVLMSEVIGRDKEKEEIIQLLICSDNQKENVSVIPIVGMGGLGKTTLAQLINKDERVVEYFELRIWVCVSEDFKTKSLVMKILKSITNNEVDGDLDLESQLRQKLDGKRYLLMLDDVWNETSEKWVGVRNLLMSGAKGSIVVVTTRSRIVASVMGVKHPYVLHGLSKKNSWILFEKVAFRGHEKKMNLKLKVIGKEIVKRCKGVPLAITSLASVMQSKTKESEWLFIQNSDIWRDDDILPILKLSYDYLPSYLKQCFAYCAIFPKDHEIEKEFLIQLWMAQGYVQSLDGSQYSEEIGNQYFRDLLSRSFFQKARVHDGVLITCKMHDLIHDLAMRVAGFECCIVERDAYNICERVRHVSVRLYGTEVPTQLMKAKGLRTLLGRDSLDIYKEFGRDSLDIYNEFRFLRVLDVHSCEFEEEPSSIGKLQHLRYLDLSGNYKMISLPNSICKLINLQTLKLSRCGHLRRLPEGITKLINLRYLKIDGCSSLEYMPSGMGKLSSLRRLNKFVVGGNNWGLQLHELNGLNELKGDISIEGLENVEDGKLEAKEATLMAKEYLHSLTLRWGGRREFVDKNKDELLLEGLQPHPILRELSIQGYSGKMFPSWMTTGNIVLSLPNIVRITLYSCHRCKHLPQSLDQLPSLKFLTLHELWKVEHINDDENNNNLNGVVVERKSSSTTSTSTAAEGRMSVFFPSLEELFIRNLRKLKGWWRAAAETSSLMAGEEEERASESSQLPSFPRLTRLTILDCEQLTSMPIHLPHLETLYLIRVPEKLVCQLLLLTTTTTSATTSTTITEEGSAASSSSFSSSIPTAIISSKLKSLTIWDLKSPLPVEVFRNLASLETLKITSCTRLLSCFALGSEKEEEEEEEEEEGFFRALLPSLRSLEISNCESLTSFVVSGPGGVTLIQHLLTALQRLNIYDCPSFDYDHGLHWQGLRSLLNLTIGEIPKLVSLPVGLQQLTTLQILRIEDCRGLMGLPDWLSNLTSLQSLHIRGCPLLSERCQKETGGEDWSNISHIPNIEINGKYIQGSLWSWISRSS